MADEKVMPDQCISADDHTELDQIAILRDALYEKRSDVADILDKILSREDWSLDDIESRYIKAKLDDKRRIQYDTLTTELSLIDEKANASTLKEHEYTND